MGGLTFWLSEQREKAPAIWRIASTDANGRTGILSMKEKLFFGMRSGQKRSITC